MNLTLSLNEHEVRRPQTEFIHFDEGPRGDERMKRQIALLVRSTDLNTRNPNSKPDPLDPK